MGTNYYTKVKILAVFTIVYNLAEGLVSVIMGIHDETLTLFGFGIDSFVEVISGFGILQMVIRLNNHDGSGPGKFEQRALRITGTAFYLLAAGLIIGAVWNIVKGHKPETTKWGLIISILSIFIMYWLFRSKMEAGRKLKADAVISDAKCTLVCIYMSVVLLISSAVYAMTGFGWVDTIGAAALAWFSFSEGREAFEKAEGKDTCC